MSSDHAKSNVGSGKRVRDEDNDDDFQPTGAKRLRSWQESGYNRGLEHREPSGRLRHFEYTVGWICALPIELAASQAMLDRIHEDLPKLDTDTNAYTLGNIGTHNIVMACLPAGQYGTNNAAIVASDMYRSFPSIRVGLMVGIGGGVPGDVDVRLGDIVIGKSVVQYDMGKILSGGQVQRTGAQGRPPPVLLKAFSKLQALHERTPSEVPSLIKDMLERYPDLAEYAYPSTQEDRLFRATYDHDQAADCNHCDLSELVDRPLRRNHDPKIHYGGIASGNQVVKCGTTRDAMAKELDIICFEMEAAGLMDVFPCIVIRGICDYADSHKNKQWQRYAAATAAAFAKELLSVIAPNAMEDTQVTNTLQQTSSNTQEQLQARRGDILDLMRFDQIDSRHATIKAAHAKTCEWLLKHDSYKNWLDFANLSQHHGFLWISGKPGAGKSTLMKFAFSRVKKRHSAGTAYASFFFNGRGDDLEKTTAGLHRSLLLQLLERFPDLQSVLDDLGLVPLSQTCCPTIEILRDLFGNAIMKLGQRRLICFVDALDECDEEQVREMVTYFEELGERAATNGIGLQICFSSRHYPHIDIRNGIRITLEDQPGHEQDLEKYVRNSLKAGKRSDAENIQTRILEKANGVFMWVVLVVDILNKEYSRGRIFAVQRRLAEIPSRLSELFKDILMRDSDNMEDLLLCIQWILYAKRPLSRQEFYFAILSGLSNEELIEYKPEQITPDDLERFVVSSSKGLAEITKSKSETIQFIHESVRDFLIKDNGLRQLWPSLGQNFQSSSHDKLKECCRSYIKFERSTKTPTPEPLPKANSEEAKELRRTASESFPFLGYAIDHVLHHADVAAGEISQDSFLDQFPLQDWIHLNNMLEKHQTRRYTPAANLTYILAEKNFVNLLEVRVRNHPYVHVMGERHGFPLFAALFNGHRLAAKTLLGQAASPYEYENLFMDLNYKKNYLFRKGQGPLHWAIENKHAALAKFLVTSNHIDLTMKDAIGRTALHSAALFGDEATIALLVERFDEFDQQSLCEMTPSHIAQKSGMATANSLVNKSAYIDTKDTQNATPLFLASENGFEPAVKTLLYNGASTDCKNTHNQTPLSIAAANGHMSVVRALLDNGASTECMDEEFQTPLHQAAVLGHETVVRALLENGASTECTDKYGHTPLVGATTHGWESVVRALLDNGASTDCKNIYGKTPFLIAVARGHEGIVRALFDNETSADCKTKNG